MLKWGAEKGRNWKTSLESIGKPFVTDISHTPTWNLLLISHPKMKLVGKEVGYSDQSYQCHSTEIIYFDTSKGPAFRIRNGITNS